MVSVQFFLTEDEFEACRRYALAVGQPLSMTAGPYGIAGKIRQTLTGAVTGMILGGELILETERLAAAGEIEVGRALGHPQGYPFRVEPDAVDADPTGEPRGSHA